MARRKKCSILELAPWAASCVVIPITRTTMTRSIWKKTHRAFFQGCWISWEESKKSYDLLTRIRKNIRNIRNIKIRVKIVNHAHLRGIYVDLRCSGRPQSGNATLEPNLKTRDKISSLPPKVPLSSRTVNLSSSTSTSSPQTRVTESPQKLSNFEYSI